MQWQDIMFPLGSILLSTSLASMIWSSTKPPLKVSVTNMAVMFAFAFTFLTLNLLWSGLTTFLSAGVWAVLAGQVLRSRARAKKYDYSLIKVGPVGDLMGMPILTDIDCPPDTAYVIGGDVIMNPKSAAKIKGLGNGKTGS